MAIITYGLLIFIFSVAGGFKQLAILASAALLLVYLAVILATIKLRMRNQHATEKTFVAPGGYITPLIGIASIIWLLSSLSLSEIISTVIFIAAVSAIYFLMKRLQVKNQFR
jgi:L-asparagine transporter-like permease